MYMPLYIYNLYVYVHMNIALAAANLNDAACHANKLRVVLIHARHTSKII